MCHWFYADKYKMFRKRWFKNSNRMRENKLDVHIIYMTEIMGQILHTDQVHMYKKQQLRNTLKGGQMLLLQAVFFSFKHEESDITEIQSQT